MRIHIVQQQHDSQKAGFLRLSQISNVNESDFSGFSHFFSGLWTVREKYLRLYQASQFITGVQNFINSLLEEFVAMHRL